MFPLQYARMQEQRTNLSSRLSQGTDFFGQNIGVITFMCNKTARGVNIIMADHWQKVRRLDENKCYHTNILPNKCQYLRFLVIYAQSYSQ